jgi:outer membrane protein OmpA-like peptidoglycan-associated protein
MKKIIITGMVCIAPFIVSAQLGSLINKAKNKIKDRIDNKVDRQIDKNLDEAEGKETTASGNQAAGAKESSATAAKPAMVSWSKYDFIPGEKVIFADDFSQDNIGELPVNFITRGKGELVTLDNVPGKWLRLFQGNTYLAGNSKAFGENYTIEFDLILDGTVPSGTRFFPGFSFGLFASGSRKVTDANLFSESQYINKNYVSIGASPNADAISKMELLSMEQGGNRFKSGDDQLFADFSKTFFKVAHYAIQVQKQRLRLWVNQYKVFDLPQAVFLTTPLNGLFFGVAKYWPYNDNNFGLYISNIKVAAGVADTRHKLIDEGKFSTTGILFAVQSAVVKPESLPVMKEIAAVLKENSNIKIKIIGHTSNDGDDAANMELSKQRAAAVKDVLVKEFSIDAARIETEGKGETQPVADNKTKEGREQNRRVEFVKL